MAQKALGLTYVARYMGVTKAAVALWVANDPKFPKADVEIIGPDGRTLMAGWYRSSLAPMRPWYNERKGLKGSAAHRHWKKIDQTLPALDPEDGS